MLSVPPGVKLVFFHCETYVAETLPQVNGLGITVFVFS